jgi:hypothetical protein
VSEIAEVLLDVLASLEVDGSGPIHEDDVVRILESAQYEMSRLDPESKARLREAARRKADETSDPRRREFFRDAPRVYRLDTG